MAFPTRLSAVLGLLLLSTASAAEIGRVMSVEDGASVVVVVGGGTRRLSLAGVSVPAEPAAAQAGKARLAELVLAKVVRYEVEGDGVRLWLGATDVNAAMGASERRSAAAVQAKAESAPPAPEPPTVSAPPVAVPATPVAAEPVQAPEAKPAVEAVAPAVAGVPPPRTTVVAHRGEGVYHRADCPGYARVPARHRLEFASAATAEREGYRLAGNCPRSR